MPENRKRIGIFEAGEALESEARDVAEARLLEDQAKLKGAKLFDTSDPNFGKLDISFSKNWEQLKNFPKGAWRVLNYNILGEFTRQKEIRRVRKEMVKEGSIYGAGEQTADMEARHAVADRLINEIYQGDEESKISEGISPEIGARIKALTERYARGATVGPDGEIVGTLSDDDFNTQRKSILAEYSKKYEANEAGLKYADNMLLVAREIRNAVAHGDGVQALVDELEFVTGKAKMGARTEAKYNRFDGWMKDMKECRAFGLPLGSFISETSASLAAAAVYSVITSGAVWSGRRALALIGGAGVAGAMTGAVTERLKFTEERQLVAREMAKGKQFNPDNAPRRKELAGTFIEPKQASEFMDPLEALFEDVDGVRMLSLTVTQDQLREAMATLSDLQARREMMDRFEKEDNRVDLIAYSDGKSLEKERSELFKLQADAEVAIKALLRSNVHEHLGPDYDPATLDYKIADHVNGREFLNETEILQAIEDARVEALAAGKDPSNEDVMNDSLASQLENLRNVKGFAVAPIESAYEKNFAIPHLKREEKRRESYHRWDTSQASKILKNIKLKKDLFEIKHFNSEGEVDAYLEQLKKTQEQVAIVDDLGSMEDKQRLFEKMRANKSWVAARNGFLAGTVIGGVMTGVKPLMGWLSGWFHDHIHGGHGHTMILPTDSYHSGEVSLPAGLELHPRNLASGRVIWDMFKDGKEVAHGLVQHETGRFGLVTEDGAIGDIDSAWGKVKGTFFGGKDLNEILKENNIRMTEVSERYHFGNPDVAGTTASVGHGAGGGAGIGRVVDAVRHAGDPLKEGLPTSGPEIHLEAERNLSWTEWLAKVKENPATVKEFGIRHIAHRGWGDNDTPMHDVSESHGAGGGMDVDDKLSEKLYTHADSPARPHILSHEVNGSEHVTKYDDGTVIKLDTNKSLRDHRFSIEQGSSHRDGIREYKFSDGRTIRIDPSTKGHFTVSRESVGGNSAESYDSQGQPPPGLAAKGGANGDGLRQDEAGRVVLNQKYTNEVANGWRTNEDVKLDDFSQPIPNEEVVRQSDTNNSVAHEAVRHSGADGYETRLMDPVVKDGHVRYVLKGLKPDDSFHGGHHVNPMAEAAKGKLKMLFSFGHGAKDVIEVPAHLDGHGNAVADSIAKGSNLDKILHEYRPDGSIKRLYENVEAAVIEEDGPKGARIFTVATDSNHHKGGWKLPGFNVTEPEPVTPTPPTETPPVPPTETPNPGTEAEPKHMRFGTRNTTIFDYTEPQWDGPRIWPIPMRDRDPLEASTAPVPRATRARGARGGVGGGGAGTGTPPGRGGGGAGPGASGPGATGPGTTAGAGPAGPGATGPTGPGTTAGSGPGSTTGAGPGATGPTGPGAGPTSPGGGTTGAGPGATGPGSAAGAGPKGPTGPGADPRLSKPPFDWESDPRVGRMGTRDPKLLKLEKEARKKEYRKAARLVHPDKFAAGDPMRVRAESLWKYLDQAYRDGNWPFFDDLYDIVLKDYNKPKAGTKTSGTKGGSTGPVGGGAGAGSAKGAGPSATGPGTTAGTGPGATGPSAAGAGGPASAGPSSTTGSGAGATAGSGPDATAGGDPTEPDVDSGPDSDDDAEDDEDEAEEELGPEPEPEVVAPEDAAVELIDAFRAERKRLQERRNYNPERNQDAYWRNYGWELHKFWSSLSDDAKSVAELELKSEGLDQDIISLLAEKPTKKGRLETRKAHTLGKAFEKFVDDLDIRVASAGPSPSKDDNKDEVEIPPEFAWKPEDYPNGILDIVKHTIGRGDVASYVTTEGFEMSFGRFLYSWCKTAPDPEKWITENLNLWDGNTKKVETEEKFRSALLREDVFSDDKVAIELGHLVHEGWAQKWKKQIDDAVNATALDHEDKRDVDLAYEVGKLLVKALPADKKEREIMLYSAFSSRHPTEDTKKAGIRVVNVASRIARLASDPSNARSLTTLGRDYMGSWFWDKRYEAREQSKEKDGVSPIFDRRTGEQIVASGYDTMERRGGKIVAIRTADGSLPELKMGLIAQAKNGERAVITGFADPVKHREEFVGVSHEGDVDYILIKPSDIAKLLSPEEVKAEQASAEKARIERVENYLKISTQILEDWVSKEGMATSFSDALKKSLNRRTLKNLVLFDERLGSFMKATREKARKEAWFVEALDRLTPRDRRRVDTLFVSGFQEKEEVMELGEIFRESFARQVVGNIDSAVKKVRVDNAGLTQDLLDELEGAEIQKLLPSDPNERYIVLLTSRNENSDEIGETWAMVAKSPSESAKLAKLAKLWRGEEVGPLKPSPKATPPRPPVPPSPASGPKPAPKPKGEALPADPKEALTKIIEQAKVTGARSNPNEEAITIAQRVKDLYHGNEAFKAYIDGKADASTIKTLRKKPGENIGSKARYIGEKLRELK